jgi:predicted kinase
MTGPGTLHMLCGKIASGKSTLARRLAAETGAMLLSQDHLLSRLYPGEILDVADFARCSKRLSEAIGPHIAALLRAGIGVVMDFEANTPASRAWMRSLFEAAAAPHILHILDVEDGLCLERLRLRNASGTHEYEVSEQDFAYFTRWFSPPDEVEGFVVRRYAAEA